MEIIIAVIGSGALSALISGLFTVYSNRKKKDDGVRSGVRILLYDRIKHLGNVYINSGSVTGDAYEDLLSMHEAYHELGGNGYLDRIMADVGKLKRT